MIYTDFNSEGWFYAEPKAVVFGGTGGLGSHLVESLGEKYSVAKIGSKDVDVRHDGGVKTFLKIFEPEVVVNMSGVNYNSFIHKLNLESLAEAEKMIDVNIWGNIHILNNALPYMRKNNYGRIILASSVLSTKTVVGTSIYSATKSFLDTMVRVAAAENASKHVTINTLRLGYFDAGLTHKIPMDNISLLLNEIPAHDFGQPIDIANLVNCIINSEYINGANIDINGGLNGI